jgi:hypothetical protein
VPRSWSRRPSCWGCKPSAPARPCSCRSLPHSSCLAPIFPAVRLRTSSPPLHPPICPPALRSSLPPLPWFPRLAPRSSDKWTSSQTFGSTDVLLPREVCYEHVPNRRFSLAFNSRSAFFPLILPSFSPPCTGRGLPCCAFHITFDHELQGHKRQENYQPGMALHRRYLKIICPLGRWSKGW